MNNIIIGNRIPRDFFVTKGKGESDITIHAGSYHLAMIDAGIECYNLMTYSSILPPTAREIKKPDSYDYGSVAETIMAVSSAKKGERATAGVVFGWIHNKETGEKIGGMVCEHNGNYTEEEIRENLNASLNEMFTEYCKKYDADNVFELRDIIITIESIVPEKNYGTAMVVLCFVNYVYPIVSGEENE